MKKSELIKELEESVSKIQKEYDEQREAKKHHRTPGNPYIVGLGARLMAEKDFLDKLKNLTSLK